MKIRPHNFSYVYHCGDIAIGLLVCHSCNNKLCVNPRHLYLGTHADNTRDASADDLLARCERHGQVTLSNAEAIELRRKYLAAPRNKRGRVLNGYVKRLAEEFNTTRATVVHLGKSVTWVKLEQDENLT